IGQITLDNASNNNTMMASLEFELTVRDVPFHRDGNRIRYVHSTEDYRRSLESDLVSRVRQIITLCRASGNRRDDFRETVMSMCKEMQKNGAHECADDNDNMDGLLERVVVLLRDVDTRWSSTFFMVDRFLELYPAIERFITNDPKLSDTVLFSAVDIQVLNDIREYLYLFHSIQELASAEKTPTLSIVLPLYEGLIEMLGLMKSTLPNLAHIIEVSLRKLHEYVDKARGTRIYALAMAINPTTKLNWINENWPRSDADQAREWLKSSVCTFLLLSIYYSFT
ncbi:ribonuclease H-like domain-containing protein, partial [Lentinula edodes]|uniref:ribonuclease H-like domain-containing protein n=1 Tax=Lentinula edodes TaxID=5353 RepID=UPI001E8D7030